MKAGFVALIRRPNVGESALMNHLIGQKITVTSEKIQTARNQIRTVYTNERGRIMFEDTPGLTRAKNKLGHFMVGVAEKTTEEADVILWIVDVSEHIGVAERELAERLRKCRQPLILTVDKIDKITNKARLAAQVKAYEDFCRPKDLVAVAALKSENVEPPFGTLYHYLPERPFFYSEDTMTEGLMRELVGELIREQTLRLLRDEVSHGVTATAERMKERGGDGFDIDASITCERESYKGMVIGKDGQMLKRIGIGARKIIKEMAESKVNLKLWVKVRCDWRDSDARLRSFGYDIKKV